MLLPHLAFASGGTSGEDGEDGSDAFAAGVADVVDVWLHGGIEGAHLVADLCFHLLEFPFDQFGRDFWVVVGLGHWHVLRDGGDSGQKRRELQSLLLGGFYSAV